jgi:protoporphyrinogen oxidase
MGLAVAWHASRAGHDVVVLEADRIPGGMAAHFDFGGLSIERFYHFICKPDQATFDLMAELGIADRLRWRATSMGYYIDGRLYKWGDPLALLSFPLLGPIDKFRYARHVFMASKRRDWSKLDGLNVHDWIVAEAGETIWNLLWKRSFDLKFYELSDSVAAPWLGARIKRLAASRRSIFQEELGYIDGRYRGAGRSPRQGHRSERWKGPLSASRCSRWRSGTGAYRGADSQRLSCGGTRHLNHGDPIRHQTHPRSARGARCQARSDPQTSVSCASS